MVLKQNAEAVGKDPVDEISKLHYSANRILSLFRVHIFVIQFSFCSRLTIISTLYYCITVFIASLSLMLDVS